MLFWRTEPQTLGDLSEVTVELEKIGPELDRAVEQLGSDLVDEHPRRGSRQRRVGPLPTRLPSPQFGRPANRPLALPQRPGSAAPRTILERRRAQEARRRGGPPPLAAVVEEGAEQAAEVLRDRLRDLRSGLGRIRRRTSGRSR